jgi:hypothetical protein
MVVELKKIAPVALRSIGLDEKWLQDRIRDDPTILGLGDLEIFSKEHPQPFGGRIDFLMLNAEEETYYEVEVMLGILDESHIIRTIEYWDIERQRRPQFEHRAVIVAEQITSRFFNVLRLLNRSVPMIAVQLSAFQIDDGSVVLHAVTVHDVTEETTDGEADHVEQVTRAYWEKKSDPASLAVMDKIVTSLKSDGIDPQLTYNRYHVAMGTTGRNFCWWHPRKTPGHCYIEFRVSSGARDSILSSLQQQGIDATPRKADYVAFSTTDKLLEEKLPTIKDVARKAEEASSG